MLLADSKADHLVKGKYLGIFVLIGDGTKGQVPAWLICSFTTAGLKSLFMQD